MIIDFEIFDKRCCNLCVCVLFVIVFVRQFACVIFKNLLVVL